MNSKDRRRKNERRDESLSCCPGKLPGMFALLLAAALGASLKAEEPAESTEASEPVEATAADTSKDQVSTDTEEKKGDRKLPYFDPHAPDPEYRTPRAGEGFRTTIFGDPVTVDPRNRRSIQAWDLGVTVGVPGARNSSILPFASLYFWEHPDDNLLFRAVVVGVYNEILFTKSTDAAGPFELVLTFNNFTIPVPETVYVDGEPIDPAELLWGRLHGGVGVGYRQQLETPGADDNMFAVSLTAEPGYLYFNDSSETGPNFVVPQDTFELRARLQVRLDALERNLLALPHEGYAAGMDFVGGYRSNWENWGPNGVNQGTPSEAYGTVSGHLLGITGVPFVQSDRHRIGAAFHGGYGTDLDRFSAFRVGGGPDPYGEEYEALSRPIVPGTFIEEYLPSYYAILVGAYQWEPIFFTYLGLRGSISYLDRLRFDGGEPRTEDGLLTSIGCRITTGFLLNTRLQVDYDYNFDVIRDGERGAHQITAHISGEF